jgi:hypothetical protein
MCGFSMFTSVLKDKVFDAADLSVIRQNQTYLKTPTSAYYRKQSSSLQGIYLS